MEEMKETAATQPKAVESEEAAPEAGEEVPGVGNVLPVFDDPGGEPDQTGQAGPGPQHHRQTGE